MFRSIKIKFIAWFLFVFSVVFAGLGFFLYYEIEEIVIGSVDEHLYSEVHMIANILYVEEGHGQMETELLELSAAATGEYAVPLSGRYYQVVTADGRILGRSPSLSLEDKNLPVQEASPEPVFETITGPGKGPLRIMHQSFDYNIGKVTVQAADTLEEAYSLIRSFRSIILVVFPSVFALSLLSIFFMTGRVLRPLSDFSRKIGQITGLNLNERIEERGVDRELQTLANSFNTMMKRLEESFSKQRQFFSDASHELRTPTSVIKSNCEVTLMSERTTDEYKESIKKNLEVANRMAVIISRILEVSRLESKTLQLKLKDLDLKGLLSDVSRHLEPAAARSNVDINLNGRSVRVPGDRDVLNEAFTNIVDNAVKYNRPGGLVNIDVAEKNGFAVVTVEDTGIGMPESDRARIFDRFYRADKSRGVVPGTGLGLSIVKAIIEAHQGVVVVKSKVGEGTRIRVLLPKEPLSGEKPDASTLL